MVTGVLPLALEDATKTIQVFLLTGKEYVCLMTLHGDVPETKVRSVLEEFTGEIYQRPPVRAAVRREIRKRRIYAINDVEVDGRQVLFQVSCQAGTYIRKLVYDMGEVMQVGAHMRELRRVRAGSFAEDSIFSLYDILKLAKARQDEKETLARRIIRPMEEAFEHIPRILIRDSAVNAICHGADLAVPGIVKLTEAIRARAPVALFSLKGELVALARALMTTEQVLKAERGLAAKTVRVIMPADTYPRMWKTSHHEPTARSPSRVISPEGEG
jgi:H/ACA ribonucleoprotein complex subunit 4